MLFQQSRHFHNKGIIKDRGIFWKLEMLLNFFIHTKYSFGSGSNLPILLVRVCFQSFVNELRVWKLFFTFPHTSSLSLQKSNMRLEQFPATFWFLSWSFF